MYKLLIVDDEKIERDAIELLIKKEHLPFVTFQAQNGNQAVNIYKTQAIDFILMDIKMPGINGIEAGNQIMKINSKALIVYLTAWSSFDFAKKAINIGAKDYLVKPISKEELYETLNHLIQIVKEREIEKENQKLKIRSMLNQFSKSFFISLKHGTVSTETLKAFFNIEQLKTPAVALVFNNKSQTNLANFLNQKDCGTKLYYFERPATVNLIAFPINLKKFLFLAEEFSITNKINIGVGKNIESLLEIKTTLKQASTAYIIATGRNLNFYEFKEADSEFYDNKICLNKIISEIEQAVLNSQKEQAKLSVEKLTIYSGDNLNQFIQAVEILEYSLVSHIPYFNIENIKLETYEATETFLYILIEKGLSAIEEDKQDKYSRAFRLMADHIKTNYASIISIESCSTLLNLNEKYFSKLFKQYLHYSFLDYLTEIKMNNAMKFLKNGYSIKETANKTGYKDSAYFSRVFHKYFNINPSQCKKSD